MEPIQARPTQLQLALALTVIRSKPPDLSVPDYIHHLRRHISSGCRPQFSATYDESQHKYMNAAFYFRELWQDSLSKEEKLRNRIEALEKENDGLKLRSIVDSSPLARMGFGRLGNTTLGSDDAVDEDVGAPRFPERESMMRTALRLVKSINGKEDPERILSAYGRACRALVRAMQTLSQLMEDANPKQAQDLDLDGHFSSSTSIVRLLSTSFRQLETMKDSNFVWIGSLVCDLLSVFKGLLDVLASSCLFDDSLIQSSRFGLRIGALMHTYVCCLLDEKQSRLSMQHQQALVEGILYLVLTRAGSILSTLTFTTTTDNDVSNIAGTNASVRTPTSAASKSRANADPELETPNEARLLAAARAEGNILTPILRLLVPNTVHTAFFVDNQLISSYGPHSSGINNPLHNHPLLVHPLNKLQNTLMAGMFGDQESSVLEQSFRLPAGFEAYETELREVGSHVDNGVEEFVVEMWFRVGWDVLGKGLDV